VELLADRIAELAGRPVRALTRRDVALGLLGSGPDRALASLPMLRRGLLAAGNPMSAAYWAATETILGALCDGTARTGEVREWLEATGTEPNSIIGLHVWDDPPERSTLQAEMHAMLVRHLEAKLAAGEVDPDQLVAGDAAALRGYAECQEQWMATPLPDGRIPMDVLLDEKDAEFLAEWAAADSDALTALQAVLDEVGERPLPADQLAAACGAARDAIAQPGLTGRLLAACGGADERSLPGGDVDLWLTLAAGVVSPAGEAMGTAAAGGPPEPGHDDAAEPGPAPGESDDDDTDTVSRAIGALCALEHIDWLAAVSALAKGGPGTPASAADITRYVREYCEAGPPPGPGDMLAVLPDDLRGASDEDFDEEAVEELFSYVASLWEVLGATDAAQRLTALGWWGLPEALRKVWAPAT
jgi:hypothetical protein